MYALAIRTWEHEDMRKPLCIAHRGARREAPENTIPAFERAIEIGADGIELDVNITFDGKTVVTHNDDLSLLTGFHGNIYKETYSTIRSLDAGRHFSTNFTGEKIPSLEEVLEVMSSRDMLSIIEIKKQKISPRTSAEKTIEVISKFNFRGPVVVSSASLDILRELKKLKPKIPRAAIIVAKPFSFFMTLAYAKLARVSAIHSSTFALSRSLQLQTKALRMDLFAWTANTFEQFEKCISFGVDGIITDDVRLLHEYLKNEIRS